MKFKFLLISLLIVTCCVNLFANERDFELEISIEDKSINKNSKQVPATLTVTNRAEKSLNTAGLGFVELAFSKCEILDSSCNRFGDTYISRFRMPKKILQTNDSYNLKMNLAKMHWFSPLSSNLIMDAPKNFRTEIPAENIYLQAKINLLNGYEKSEAGNKRVPVYKKYFSNIITVVFK